MDPNNNPNPNDQQPDPATAATEPAAEAAAAPEAGQTAVDIIAAAVGIPPEDKPAETAAEEVPAAPKVLTDEEKAKAEEDRLDAEAKAFGLTKPDTTAKFKELSRAAARAKELEPEIETLRTQVAQQQEVFDHLDRNGITGDQFGQAVMVLSFMNSGDPVRMQRAYETLGQQMAELGRQLGLEAPGVDPLDSHPDLKERVGKMDLEREDALEIARSRQLQAATTRYSTQQGQAQTAQQEQERVVRELTELERSLRAQDAQFDAKWAMLKPTLMPVLSRLPLNERANAFLQAYAAFQLPAAPASPAQTRPDPANPGRPAMGAGAKAPTNSAEAIMRGLQIG